MIIPFKVGGMNLEISKSGYNGCYAPAFSTSQTHMMTEYLMLPEEWHFSVSRHAQTCMKVMNTCSHLRTPHALTCSRCVSIELHHWDVVGDLSADFAARAALVSSKLYEERHETRYGPTGLKCGHWALLSTAHSPSTTQCWVIPFAF